MGDFTVEFNADGIVGPSHNYAGLSFGNLASSAHRNAVSNPRAAALEGLDKMRRVAERGIPQLVLPPQRRPRLELLRACGFAGSDQQLLAAAERHAPELLAACYSASSMWTANAATVSPSADCDDGRVHLTVANLTSTLHRAIEADSTWRLLRFLLPDERHFAIHTPLGPGSALADEGAANHLRLCSHSSAHGLEIFVFGRTALGVPGPAPRRYPARQSLEACQAIARRHRLCPDHTLFFQQNPEAIDAGAFHNDVIALASRDLLLVHERAFFDQTTALPRLQQQFAARCGTPLHVIEIRERDLSLDQAVAGYLFNSQLLYLPDGTMTLLVPQESRESPEASRCLDSILAADNPIQQVVPVELRQSMQNGGGPGCLRLRIELNSAQQSTIHPGVRYSPELHTHLAEWVGRHYRDRLAPQDLADPFLPQEIELALVELASILKIPPEIVLDLPA